MDFIPINEAKLTAEDIEMLAGGLSYLIRSAKEEERLPRLREQNIPDKLLKTIYIQGLNREDYETCSVMKALLDERGITL